MKFKVTEISREELSDLISSAIYGNDYMDVRIKKNDWKALVDANPELEDVIYHEDKCAHLLLNNGCIYVTDMDAEEEVYGNLPHTIDAETGQVTYQVKLEDVLNGLSNEEVRWAITDWDNMDLTSAYAIMQAIAFGEVVYG
jgi:hypothetical protein